MISLRWFRDQGRGQEAADAIGADQFFGVLSHPDEIGWPCAKFVCRDSQHAESLWWRLLREFGVNAETFLR